MDIEAASTPRRSRRFVLAALKITAGVAVIVWMANSGRLDFGRIGHALLRLDLLAAIAALVYAQLAVTGVRCWLLLYSQRIQIPLRDMLSLTMIGALFNTVLPGSVGGDVMKAYYLCQRAPGAKSQVLTTLLIDRILGLLALLILPMIAAAWNLDLLARVPAMKALFYAVAAAVAMAVVGFAIVAVAGPGIAARLARVSAMPRLTGLISKLLEAVLFYREKPGVLLQATALGIANHMIAVFAFMLAAKTVASVPLGYQELLFVVPLGLATTAIPISPAGIGVGQAAFFSLFSGMPGVSGRLGSEACTVYQFVMILVYLTGIAVYILYRGEVQADAKRTIAV